LGVNHASLEEGTGCLYHERYVNWLDKLERRIGFIAIPGLIRIVVGFTALVFILVRLQPEFQYALALDPADAYTLDAYGNRLAIAGRLQDALVNFEKARAIEPATAVPGGPTVVAAP
jgi:tetratricopeptide (TPR) repeat protein